MYWPDGLASDAKADNAWLTKEIAFNVRCIDGTYFVSSSRHTSLENKRKEVACSGYSGECRKIAKGDPYIAIPCLDALMEEYQLKETQQEKEAQDKEIMQRDAERIAEQKRKEQEKKARQEQQEQQRIADIAQHEAINKQTKQDEARGYQNITFEDYQLDAKSMPNGKKLVITGLYEERGNIQTLTQNPTFAVPNQYVIYLLRGNCKTPCPS